jgi:ubiquitin C-terminal hydrolase
MALSFNPKGGLSNFGNNCYLNTIIQCLRYSKSIQCMYQDNDEDKKLILRIKEIEQKKQKPCKELQLRIDRLYVYFNFKKLLYELYNNNDTQSPASFINACLKLSVHSDSQYLFREQNDISELIVFLLDAMHEAKSHKVPMNINIDEKDIKNKEQRLRYDSLMVFKKRYDSSYSWLIREYFFMVMNNINCVKCDNKLYNFTPYSMLCLPIPDTIDGENTHIYDCLDHFFAKEVFDANNQWKCEKCSNKNNNYKQSRFMDTPKTLILSLKRYENLMDGSVKKINKQVDFPLDLDLSKYKLGHDKSGCNYKLFAIGNHIGQMNFGHCYAFCRNLETNPDTWFCYNDTNVSKLEDTTPIFSQRAYLLMYQKV